VQFEDCGRYCLFESENDSWCFSTTPPMLKIGWDIYQEFSKTADKIPVKYYRAKFFPYAIIQGYLQSQFNIENLYYNEFTANVTKFTLSYFFSMIFTSKFAFCFGMGYETTPINLSLTVSQKFTDCYKVII